MDNVSPLSSPSQLRSIEELASAFLLLPFDRGVPGAVLESILAHIQNAKRLGTYDFIDVVDNQNNIGWQVKSLKRTTPVTWIRAKIPGKEELISESRTGPDGIKKLGDAIINYCNRHVLMSITTYNLRHLIYARLIDHENGQFTYFERMLPIDGQLFDPAAFEWRWSLPKKAITKEQLPALHGFHIQTGQSWFAWHGQGENQLHFKGEPTWWPGADDPHQITFTGPKQQISLSELLELLAKTKL